MSSPQFDELIGADVVGEERERLRRTHDLLLAAGPPPELPPSLAHPPGPERDDVVRTIPLVFPRRRLAAALVLAAALAVAAFGAGFLVGDADDRETAVALDATRVVRLDSGPASGTVSAVVRVGRRDPQGNLVMILAVSGLEQLPLGDYYALSMTEDGEPEVDCGTFNVRDEKRVFVRFSVGYTLEDFDGFALTRYTSEGHETTTLLTGRLA